MVTKIKVSNLSAEVNQHIAQIASEGAGIDSAQANSIISGKLSSLNQSIIPDTNITYDLGSVTNRFRDLYLSGSTIDLAGTKISTNDSGDVRFLDGNNTPKRIVVKEIELDDPTDASFKTVISRGSGGGISFIKVNRFTGILEPTIEAVDLSSNTTEDLAEGTNLYYTSIRVNSDTLAYLTANSYATQAYVNNAVEALPDSAQVRGLFSATGDLTYNSTTGQFSVTVPEGYSTVDFDSDFGTKSTSNLTEGTNLYYTTVRADSDTAAYLASNGYDTATNIIATITDAAPATLDTLNELAAALGDDPNFATTVAANIAAKLDSAEALALFSGGTGVTYNGSGQFSIGQSVATNANVTFNNISVTGTVDGRDVSADGSKLDGIEAGATADQTITAGSGLTGGGTGDVTISHADTSSQGSVNNSGATVIQDVTLDTYGHVTGLGSTTLTASTVGAPATDGTGASGTWGINITGNAATVSNGVYTTGDQTVGGTKTFTSSIVGARNLGAGAGVTPSSPWFNCQIEARSTDAGAALVSLHRSGYSHVSLVHKNTNELHLNMNSGEYLALHSGNYNSYAPTLTGGNASGTWGINITGSAAAATNALSINGNSTVFGLSGSGLSSGHGGKAGPEVQGTGGGGAVWSMHRPGAYGLNMGLDADNVFRIGGWSAAANRLQMDMSGNLTMAGNVTAYSDARLKTDLQQIENALDKVMSLTGYTYERIDTGERQTGVVAQDVQKVLPEAVRDDGEHLAVAYGNMVGLLIEAIKDQQKQIDELKARLEI